MFRSVVLTEVALTPHDVNRLAHLHDPEPVHMHVLVPAVDAVSGLDEAIEDVGRTHFSEVLHERELSPEQLQSQAQQWLAVSIAALRAAGVAEVTGAVVEGDPPTAAVKAAAELDADEVIVVAEAHLALDLTRRDWATKVRRHAEHLPVLHVVAGTDELRS